MMEGRLVRLMGVALEEAHAAAADDEVPVGAVVARGDGVVARGRNRVVSRKDPTAHAEILALRAAAEAFGSERLAGFDLVVTLEPCPMCVGAAILSRVRSIVFGARDPKGGALGSRVNLLAIPGWNHYPDCVGEVRAEEAGALLSEFFRRKRRRDGREVEGG